jgi:hypothetical protein
MSADSDMVERVARAMLAPLGYPSKTLADAERIWVGNQCDDPETGSLAYLCRALARAALDASGIGELEWLAENPALELSWGEIDNDPSECAWRVHRRQGGYNDREWTLVATGDTPLAALSRARATQETNSE